MVLCACGSAKNYANCCGLFIERIQRPETPEQLMRSRYTAYSLAKMDYIAQTMKGHALMGFNATQAEQWTKNVIWLTLEVIQAAPPQADIGFVEFRARFMERNQVKIIHEISKFHKENGFWFYVEGITKPVANKTFIARNNPCPCGSGKKFKNCHAR